MHRLLEDAVCAKHGSDAEGRRRVITVRIGAPMLGAAALEDAIREALKDRDARLATIAAVEDPIERLVCAVRFILRDFHPDEPGEMMGNIRLVDMAARRRRQQQELARPLRPERARRGV